MDKSQNNKIILIILEHVDVLGWTDRCFSLINRDIVKLDKNQQIIFQNIEELVDYYLSETNNLLLKKLNQLDTTQLKIREKIKEAIITSLLLHPKNITAHTTKFLAHPLHSNMALKSLTDMCDQIWLWVGSNDTDYNYYTKRILLGAVYTVSLAYYLKQNSDSNLDLVAFIENRIDNILQLGSIKNKIVNFSNFIFQHKSSH
jgi:ubiquinone biosynthesis protein COQ9